MQYLLQLLLKPALLLAVPTMKRCSDFFSDVLGHEDASTTGHITAQKTRPPAALYYLQQVRNVWIEEMNRFKMAPLLASADEMMQHRHIGF